MWLTARSLLITIVAIVSLVLLALLGALAARAGNAPMVKPALRVTFWSALAFVVTAGIGKLFGVAMG